LTTLWRTTISRRSPPFHGCGGWLIFKLFGFGGYESGVLFRKTGCVAANVFGDERG
jgi:hypothetical protein